MKNKLLAIICLLLMAVMVLASCDRSSSKNDTEGGDTEDGDTEGGDTEDGDTEGGDTEGGDTEGGDTEGGDTEGGDTEGGDTEGGDTEGGDTEGDGTEDDDTEGDDTEGDGTGNVVGTVCSHSFSTKWTSNETHHWHAATCEHGEVKDSYAKHLDPNEDGVCDVCSNNVGHSHTYSASWSYNDTHHWKAATCTHTTEQASLSLHTDDNSDATCDKCKSHVHLLDNTGKCTACGEQVKEVDTENLEVLVNSIYNAYTKVNGGHVNYSFVGMSGGRSHSNVSKLIDYTLGVGSTYIKTSSAIGVHSTDDNGDIYETSSYDVIERWLTSVSLNEVFGVYRESNGNTVGELYVDGGASPNALRGYYYAISTLAYAYGAEDLLAVLYDISQTPSISSGFTKTHDKARRTCAFSFDSLLVNPTKTSVGTVYNANYFVVSVEFTYDESFALTNMTVVCNCYTNDPGANDSGVTFEKDIDLDYNAKTGKITLREGAAADTYTVTITQTVGERTYVTEHPKSDFMPKSLEVYSDKEFTVLAEDNITINQNEFLRLYLKDPITGRTFSSAKDELTYAVSPADPTSENTVEPYFITFDSYVFFYAKYAGDYVVTITFGDDVRIFNVTVLPYASGDEQ